MERSALGFMERMAVDELSRRVASAGEPGRDEINSRYFANRPDKLRVRGGLGQLLSAYIF